MFILCRDKALSKDDKQSIFTNILLLMDKNNRLNVSGTAVKGILKNTEKNKKSEWYKKYLLINNNN